MIIIIASQRSGQLFKLPEWLSRQNARTCYSGKQHKESIKLQLFRVDNKDKSKHSKNSKYKQIFMKECLRRLNVKVALNACAKKTVSIRQEAMWQLHSRMRQACSSRLHAHNCFHTPVIQCCGTEEKDKEIEKSTAFWLQTQFFNKIGEFNPF